MASTRIPYADVNWPVVTGCSGAGCTAQCWARGMARRFGKSFKPTFHADKLDEPLRWRKPKRVLVAFTGDLFDQEIDDEQIDSVFDVMRATPQHTYFALTKQADGLHEWASTRRIPDNVWLGISACTQEELHRRSWYLDGIAHSSHLWASIEPLLGPVTRIPPWLSWVVTAAESGPRARPCDLDWVRGLRDACAKAGVMFAYKDQTGYPALDGTVHDAVPEVTHG